jgi:hypothetical protein
VESERPLTFPATVYFASNECRKLYEKRLAGLEEELAAVYGTLEEYTHRV